MAVTKLNWVMILDKNWFHLKCVIDKLVRIFYITQDDSNVFRSSTCSDPGVWCVL